MNVDTANLVCRLTTLLADPQTKSDAEHKGLTRKQVALYRLYHEIHVARKAGLLGYRGGDKALRTVEGWLSKADEQAVAK